MKKRNLTVIISLVMILVFIAGGVMYAKETTDDKSSKEDKKLLTQEDVKTIKGQENGYDIPASVESDKESKEEKLKLEKEAEEKLKKDKEANGGIDPSTDIPEDEASKQLAKEENEKFEKAAKERAKTHIGAQIDYKLSAEEKEKRDKEEEQRIKNVIKILNKYGYYTDELLTEYLKNPDDTPVGRDIAPTEKSIEESRLEREILENDALNNN